MLDKDFVSIGSVTVGLVLIGINFLSLSLSLSLFFFLFFFYSSCPIILSGHRSLPFQEATNENAISPAFFHCGNELDSNLDMPPLPESIDLDLP